MKLFRKITAILLITSLTVSGCGGDNPTADGEPDVIVSQVVGGFFYTPPADKKDESGQAFVTARNEGLDRLREEVVLYNSKSKDLSKAYSDYEDLLFGYLNGVDSDSSFSLFVQDMGDKVIAYKAATAAHQTLIDQYSQIETGNAAERAVIDSYMFESAHKIYILQEEYFKLLNYYYIACANFIGQTDPSASEALLAAGNTHFDGQVLPVLTDMGIQYELVTDIYIHIASADYYASEVYLEEAVQKLSTLEDSEDAAVLLNMCEALKELREPPEYLIEVSELPVNLSTQTFARRPLFGLEVHAADLTKLAGSIAAVQMIQNIEGKSSDQAEAELRANAKDIKDHLQTLDPETLYKYQHLTPTERTAHYTALISNNTFKANALMDSYKVELTEAEVNQVKLINKLNEFKTTVQNTGQVSLETVFFAVTTGKVDQYSALVNILADKVVDGSTKLSDIQKDGLKNFLTNDLKNLLGEEKNILVDLLLNNSANDLVEQFNQWKDKTNGFTELNFTLDDILFSFNQLGVTPDRLGVVINQLFDAMSNPETEEEIEGLMILFNLDKVIQGIIEAIMTIFTLGLVDTSGSVENGTGTQYTNSGEIKRTSTYVDGEETVRTSYSRVDGMYRPNCFKHTVENEDGTTKEIITYRYGLISSRTVFGTYKNEYMELYTEYYEEGRLVKTSPSRAYTNAQ